MTAKPDNRFSRRTTKRLLPISRAAAFLGISIDTLRNWEEAGAIVPFRSKGGIRRYSLTQLKIFQQRHSKLARKTDRDIESVSHEPAKHFPSTYEAPRPHGRGIFSASQLKLCYLKHSSTDLHPWFSALADKLDNSPVAQEPEVITISSYQTGITIPKYIKVTSIPLAGVLVLVFLLTSLITTGYLVKPEATKNIFANNSRSTAHSQTQEQILGVSQGLPLSTQGEAFTSSIGSAFSTVLSPFNSLAQGIIQTVNPNRAQEIGIYQKSTNERFDQNEQAIIGISDKIKQLQDSIASIEPPSLPTSTKTASAQDSASKGIKRLILEDAFIGEAILDTGGKVYPTASFKGSLGTSDRLFGGLYTSQANILGSVVLGNTSSDTVKIIGRLNNDLIPSGNGDQSLGDGDHYWKNGYINKLTGDTGGITSFSTQNLTINSTTAFASHLTPSVANTYDIGSATLTWRSLYLGSNATIGGTLGVTGVSTLTGNLNANGGLDIDDAFVVADGGVLTTSQAANLNAGFDVDDAFVVADGGALTTSQAATFNGNVFFGTSTGVLASGGNVGIGTTVTAGGGLIVNTGNVGIGTTAPAALFSVGSTSQFQVNSTGAIAASTGITTSGGYTQSGTTGNTFTGTSTFSNATYSALFTGGNVGIGTTAPLGTLVTNNGANAQSIFIAQDNGTDTFTIGDGGTVTATGNINANGGLDIDDAFSVADGGVLTTSQAATFNGNVFFGTSTGVLASGGNVGIGTTAPGAMLEVIDNIFTQDNLFIGSTTESLAHTSFALDGDDLFVGGMMGVEGVIYTDNGLDVANGSLVISSAGAITTASDITLTKADPSIVFNTTTATDTDFWIGIQEDAGGDDDDRLMIGDGTTPGSNIFMTFQTDGNVGIGTTSPANKLDVEGAMAVGATYSGTSAAPSNGMIIEGNVGIGTTNPAVKLDVNGSFSVLGTTDLYRGTSATGDVVASLSSDVGGTKIEKVRIQADGNVGIGTTKPDANFHLSSGSNTRFYFEDTSAGTDLKEWGYSLSAGDLYGFTRTDEGVDGDNWIIVDRTTTTITDVTFPNGNVGIGAAATTPTHLIELDSDTFGTTTGWQDSSDRNKKENFIDLSGVPLTPVRTGTWTSSSSEVITDIQYDSGASVNLTDSELLNRLDLLPIRRYNFINDEEANKINPGAPVNRIGPTAQDFYKLFGLGASDTSIRATDVAGIALAGVKAVNTKFTTQINSLATQQATTSAKLASLSLDSSGSLTQASDFNITGNVGIGTTNPQFTLEVNGTGKLNDAAWTYASDLRLKENIASVSAGLSIIEQLNPITFDYINGGKDRAGFIAQEVQTVLPNLVNVGADGMLGIRLEELIPYTIKAIQQQQAEINGLIAQQDSLASLNIDSEGKLTVPEVKTDKLIISADLSLGQALRTQGLALNNPDGSYSVDVLAAIGSISEAILGISTQESTTSAQLASLENKVASNSSALADLQAQVASLAAQASTSSAQTSSGVGSDSPEVSLQLTSPDLLLATGSATLVNLSVTSEATFSGQLLAYSATISETFKSLGNTFLGNTTIAGDLSVDGTLSISQNSLNVIGTTGSTCTTGTTGSDPTRDTCDTRGTSGILFIQNSPLATLVDFFNGQVTINKEGNLAVESLSVGSSTLGSGTIPAGQTEIPILNTNIKDNSKIFLTPTSNLIGNLVVLSQNPGVGFTIKITQINSQDITFNWWVVQSRD